MSKAYQVVGIGNAVSDVIATSSDDFLAEHGVEKGIMQLVDQPRAEALFAAMGSRTETPGGSVANTIAGLGSLGLRTAFIGRVADDDLGYSYALAMQTEGTDFPNPPVRNAELPTSRSMIFVSPDGERSMNTYLGISSDVGPEDVSDAVIADCEILFLEGYLFDKAPGKEAFRKAASLARQSGARAGISLSDPFCVDRHREDFRALVTDEVDILFGNEEELLSLYQLQSFQDAVDAVRRDSSLAVITRGPRGASIITRDEVLDVPAENVPHVIDTTGAGDLFAAGFLFGYTNGYSLENSAILGSIAAGEVISHVGPRPLVELRTLLPQF